MLRGIQNWIGWMRFGISIFSLSLSQFLNFSLPPPPTPSSWLLSDIQGLRVLLGIESAGLMFHGIPDDYGWYNCSGNLVNWVVLVPRIICCDVWRLRGRFIYYFLFVSTKWGGNRTILYPMFMYHTHHVIPSSVQSNDMYNI